MKKIILHIGRHKSGTSSLQSFLHNNSEFLKEMGVLYPSTGRQGKVAHHHLANLLERPDLISVPLQDLQKNLAKESAEFDTLIISSEAFQNCKNLSLLRSFFKDYQLHIVVYFREILDYLQSAYAQRVQNTDESRSFETYASATKLNYLSFYNRWAEIADSISVHYFHRSALKNQNIIDDFLAVSDLDVKAKELNITFNRLPEESNPSIGGNLLYCKLLYNRLGYKTESNLYQQLSKIALIRKDAFANGFFISSELAKEIRDLYSYNNRFIETYCANLEFRDFSQKPKCPDITLLEQDLTEIVQILPNKVSLADLLYIHNNPL